MIDRLNVLGIDPGTYCGYALLDRTGRRITSGVWNLSIKPGEGAGMRYLRLRYWLREMLDKGHVDTVAYEDVARHTGTDAAHVYGGIVAHIQAMCEAGTASVKSIPYSGVAVGMAKRVATGKGNAGKLAMVEAANQRWHLDLQIASRMAKNPKTKLEERIYYFPGGGDNEADALWIAEAHRSNLIVG